jgi:hypothetical protein
LHFEGDGTERTADGPSLHEEIRAEARHAAHAEGEIELPVFFESQLLCIGQHRVAKLLGVDG